MKSRTYTSEGIIIFRKNYKEADRIIVVLSKKYGKLSLIAKGIRKIKSKKRGHLEIFNQIKFSAVVGRSFDILTEVEVIDNYPNIRTNLNKITLAYYFCEVLNRIVRDEDRTPLSYNLLSVFLKRLQKEIKLKELRAKFIYELLTRMGYWPIDKKLTDADSILNDVLEKKINSVRVGRAMLQ